MFLRSEQSFDGAGGAAALRFGRAPIAEPGWRERIGHYVDALDLVPDLGRDIGSATWWRGAATCATLCAVTLALGPGFDRSIPVRAPAPMTGSDFDEARAQAIAPIAYGATSGHRLGATALVVPLTNTPERPLLDVAASLGQNEDFATALRRAGVGREDAARAAGLVAGHVPLSDLKPGTQIELTLGRRATTSVPRPLDKLTLRARFDLNLAVNRQAGALALTAIPIAIDHTPLRIQGQVGPSLYRSARAAGVPAKAVEAFIRSVASRTPIGSINAGDTFDMIVERARAATGEVRLGSLLYAGVHGSSNLQLMRWEQDGKTSWYDPKGTGERRDGGATMPVAGRLTSGFGMRLHPLLGYLKMHKGLDLAAPYGAPIRAAMDGVVQMAGRAGGYGNFVKLGHSGGLASGYGHMSRIAVRNGERVSKGEVIGYVGSTGLSTGPHLHYELWRNGVPINPGKVTFESVQRLSGSALSAFKSQLSSLMAVAPRGGN